MRSGDRLQTALAVFAAFAVAAGCGNTSSSAPEADAGPPDAPDAPALPPLTATCDARHDPVGPACVPRFDACGAAEIARLGGGCVRVGPSSAACAAGFVADDVDGCRPVHPPAPCAAGELARPGDAACVELSPCGPAPFGDAPDRPTTLYVDATSAAGGDGSRARPFVRIADALAVAKAGAVVAIAAGTYAESVSSALPVTLWGRCASKVTVRGVSTTAAAITLGGGGGAHGLAVTGAQRGVAVDGAADVTLERLWVHDTAFEGIWLHATPTATVVRDVVVEHARSVGLHVESARATVDGARIAGTVESPDLPGSAAAMLVHRDAKTGDDATATLHRALFENNAGSGLFVRGVAMHADTLVVRDSAPLADGTGGEGIYVSASKALGTPGSLELHDAWITGGHGRGVLVESAAATLTNVVVRDVLPDASDGTLGRGITVQRVPGLLPASLALTDSIVERVQEIGVEVAVDATATLTRSVIRQVALAHGTGAGVFGQRLHPTDVAAPHVTLVDSLVRDTALGGILVTGDLAVAGSRIEAVGAFGLYVRGGALTVDATLVDDVRPNADGVDGQGIYATSVVDVGASLPAKVTVTDTVVDRAHGIGLAAFGAPATLARVVVRDVTPSDSSGGLAFGMAFGPEFTGETLTDTLDDVLVERSTGCGIDVFGATATLTHVVVRDTRAEAGGRFGDGIEVGGAVGATSGDYVRGALDLEASSIEHSARAGIGVFGAALTLGGSRVLCNGFDVDAETQPSGDGGAEQPYTLVDRGDNGCGCGVNGASCAAQSASLQPVGPPTKTGR